MLSRLLRPPRASLLDLRSLLPTSCALCGESGTDALCGRCQDAHVSGTPCRCTRCAVPLPAASPGGPLVCGECLKRPPAFDATLVASDYAPPVDQLVLALKFGNRLELAPLLAGMLAQTIHGKAPPLPVYLTAVPLGPGRLAQRGFNQSLEIARTLARTLRIRLEPGLVARLRETQAQALLHPDERHRNVKNAFTVPARAIPLVQGRHIGIVDDVMTTGETLNELAATLKRFGAARVTNLVFARTC